MIENFESGKWYRYTGKKRLDGWNSFGKMDFCLDNKPHQCSVGDGLRASFHDSPNSTQLWEWNKGFENWEKVDSKGKHIKATPIEKHVVIKDDCQNFVGISNNLDSAIEMAKEQSSNVTVYKLIEVAKVKSERRVIKTIVSSKRKK